MHTFTDNGSIKNYHIKYLYDSVDGRRLALGVHAPFINNWISCPIHIFSGRDFTDMVKLKHGILYTRFMMQAYVLEYKHPLLKTRL